MAFAMGNGRRVRFWKDKWCGGDLLSTSFPSLYAITSSKEAWYPSADGSVWAPCFFRQLNDWEVVPVECFFQRLQGRRVCRDDKVFGQSQRIEQFLLNPTARLWSRKDKALF